MSGLQCNNIVPQSGKESPWELAVSRLMEELKKGEDSVRSEDDWISEEELFREFGVEV